MIVVMNFLLFLIIVEVLDLDIKKTFWTLVYLKNNFNTFYNCVAMNITKDDSGINSTQIIIPSFQQQLLIESEFKGMEQNKTIIDETNEPTNNTYDVEKIQGNSTYDVESEMDCLEGLKLPHSVILNKFNKLLNNFSDHIGTRTAECRDFVRGCE